jgi:hypothetical protein
VIGFELSSQDFLWGGNVSLMWVGFEEEKGNVKVQFLLHLMKNKLGYWVCFFMVYSVLWKPIWDF